MFSEHHLDVTGHRSQQVPNTFVRQAASATQVAIFLPGFGYSCDMPLFYYTESLLLNIGADVHRVEYAYNREPGFRELSASDQLTWQLADAAAALDAALQQREYQQVIVVGKSIGTRAMGYLLNADARPQDTQAVWLTPLLGDETLRQQIRECGARSLFVIGAADPHYEPEFLREMSETSHNTVVNVPDGDHSLDIAGDSVGSIRALEHVVARIGAFLMG